MSKDYLGDSVYAEISPHRELILTMENGYGPSNTIVLETAVISALIQYLYRTGVLEIKDKSENG
jgi:hypothetical protein